MNRNTLLQFASSLPNAGCDCPFEEDFETTVFRHTDTGRWFGLLLTAPSSVFGEREEVLNLKCPPELSELLQANDKNVTAAYHMNKRHWISVRYARSDAETVGKLVKLSYELTEKRPKCGKNKNNL